MSALYCSLFAFCFGRTHRSAPTVLCCCFPEFYPSAYGTSPKTGEELVGHSCGGGMMTFVSIAFLFYPSVLRTAPLKGEQFRVAINVVRPSWVVFVLSPCLRGTACGGGDDECFLLVII